MMHGGRDVNIVITPHLGRISYGAGELRRLYIRHMTLAFIFSSLLTTAMLSATWFLVEPEGFTGHRNVVRILKYSEIELPKAIADVDIGLSAYPILERQDGSVLSDASLPASSFIRNLNIRKKGIPGERKSDKGIGDLPGLGEADKLQADDKVSGKNVFGNERAPSDRDDIAGGGELKDPWRRGGMPVPAGSGDPPGGVDISGVGSSSKPAAGTSAYGMGDGSGGDGEGGGFSMQWLKGLTRRKISGSLPVYPAGSKVSAQIRIVTVVLPDGTVRSVQPAQKADRLLEESAMKAIRTWKFEPLRKSLPQVEQTCIITFSFKLK
jgi:TonB family protein